MNAAKYFEEIVVTDPDTGGLVEVDMFIHQQSGGIFGIDASYLDQCFDDDEDPVIDDPFNPGEKVTLFGW